MSFFGIQPLRTQVPPGLSSSITATFAPYEAEILAALTPPDPAPITTRSYILFELFIKK